MRKFTVLSIFFWCEAIAFQQPQCNHSLLREKVTRLFQVKRRDFLDSIGVASVSLYTPSAIAVDEPTGEADFDLQCLLDLPPKPSDCVRLYMCRHGQTENNRLRIVQGRRIDPPINNNGVGMAKRLGKALANLEDVPSVMVHSPLLRAKQTAEIAGEQFVVKPRFETLNSISEVDFGPVIEGQPASEVRSRMMKSYGAWSIGLLDTHPEGGGESGRDVLERSSSALQSLISLAMESQAGCVAAVAHSTFLKILLALVMEEPLAKASSRNLANAGINVLDMKLDGSLALIKRGSDMFGGRSISRAPSDFKLKVPSGNVVRINEDRHLRGMA